MKGNLTGSGKIRLAPGRPFIFRALKSMLFMFLVLFNKRRDPVAEMGEQRTSVLITLDR
jgi:hypothetical protein